MTANKLTYWNEVEIPTRRDYKKRTSLLKVVQGDLNCVVIIASRIEVDSEKVVQGWFVPDPAEQFANPYLAMGTTKREESFRWKDLASGEPVALAVVYVDPDGEFVHLIIGAVIGGTFNLLTNLNNVNNFWDGAKYFGVGAAAGALTAGVGAAMAGNAAAGVTNGLIQGTGNGLIGGDNIGDAFNSGLDQAWKQGIGGAVIGGVAGGFQAKGQGKDFWTGATKDDVVVQITSDGRVIDKSATEQITYNPNNPDQVDVTYYKNHRTILNDPNHPTINRTINSDGTFEFTTKLPKRLEISGRTLSDPSNVPFISQKGRNLSMTFFSEPNDIMLNGTRFHNRPIHRISDLFNTTRHTAWQDRRLFPWNW